MRLYYSVRLAQSGDTTYYVALIALWSLGEMASGFLAMCLPVSPKFFQSLKQITLPSWISITGPFLGRSTKTGADGYLSKFYLPQQLEKATTCVPVKRASSSISRPVGSSSCAEMEPDDSHSLRCIEIPTKDEQFDSRKPALPAHW